VIHPDGWVLTNNHVIEGSTRIQVQMKNGDTYEAKVVGADPRTDVALLRIRPKEKLVYAPLGQSEVLEIGEWVLAIGNPFGLGHTVTQGIISAKGRTEVAPDGKMGDYTNFLQTDASINPGNSGGPLINMKGEVIGINTAINAAGQGIGFAIPIDMVKTLLPQLRAGHVQRSWLGVQIARVPEQMAREQGMARATGALVAEVVQDGPAEHAGLQPGDIITQFDGKPVHRMKDLPWLASTAGIGKRVEVAYRRGGRAHTVSLTMGAMPGQAVFPSPAGPDRRERAAQTPGADVSPEGFGLTATPLTEELARRLQIPADSGAVVIREVAPGGPAAAAGVQVGDVILKISNQPVDSVKRFRSLANGIEKGRMIMLLVVRKGEHRTRKLFRAFTRQ